MNFEEIVSKAKSDIDSGNEATGKMWLLAGIGAIAVGAAIYIKHRLIPKEKAEP